MAPDQIAVVAGRDYTAGYSIFTQPGVIGRAAISPAREVQTVRAQVTLQRGQKGMEKLRDQYGDRLLCLCYRYDAASQRRLKIVEFMVDEAPWRPERTAPRRRNG
jgi:hypothetical protein